MSRPGLCSFAVEGFAQHARPAPAEGRRQPVAEVFRASATCQVAVHQGTLQGEIGLETARRASQITTCDLHSLNGSPGPPFGGLYRHTCNAPKGFAGPHRVLTRAVADCSFPVPLIPRTSCAF